MKTTIVTAADRNFVWGSFLLLASLRCHKVPCPVNILSFGLSADDEAVLRQFPDVALFSAAQEDPRNIACQKAQAIYTARETDCIAWVDSDCIVTGQICEYFEVPPGKIQIRMRPPKEIEYLFRLRYDAGEERGRIPQRVLDIWKKDVNGRTEPQVTTSCNACAFVVHSSDLGFIHRWEAQIQKVIPPENMGIVNDSSFAYFLLDETVMASMLAFDVAAPEVTTYCLEGQLKGQLVHFGGTPKPWDMWNVYHLPWFTEVIDLVDWAKGQGYRFPSKRWVFNRHLRPAYGMIAKLFDFQHVTKRFARDRAKKVLRKLNLKRPR